MPKHFDAALEHIRLMEARIARQAKEVEKLRNSGDDHVAATQRLALLKAALTEMREQLGQLSPREADIKRQGAAPQRPPAPKKKKRRQK